MGLFQKNVFQHPAVFQTDAPVSVSPSVLTGIDTGTYSRHPVNCVMVTDMVCPKKRIIEWSDFGGKVTEKTTVMTPGARRLSKAPASFTSVTKRADRFN